MQIQGKFLLSGTVSKAVIFIEGPPPTTDILLNSLVVKHAEKTPPAPAPDFSVSFLSSFYIFSDKLQCGFMLHFANFESPSGNMPSTEC